MEAVVYHNSNLSVDTIRASFQKACPSSVSISISNSNNSFLTNGISVFKLDNVSNECEIPRLFNFSNNDSKQQQQQEEEQQQQQQQARVFLNRVNEIQTLERQEEDNIMNKSRVFVVGAGGIGCELLKDLYLGGWRQIEVIDLDTIDATNLNRQFLFRPEDVGKPKSQVAVDRILAWASSAASSSSSSASSPSSQQQQPLTMKAHHGNVKDASFNAEFYRQFSVVINGLDNVSARKHVNRVCMEAGVPLVESGTMGYNGQAQPILRGKFECYDCNPKSAEQKQYALCTIHSKPTSIIHCVHYARELYSQLFGDSIQGASEFDFLNQALQQKTQNQSSSSSSSSSSDLYDYARKLGDAVFNDKVKQLIALRTAGKEGNNNNRDQNNSEDGAEKKQEEQNKKQQGEDQSSSSSSSSFSSSTGERLPMPIPVDDQVVQNIKTKEFLPAGENEANPSIQQLLAQLFEGTIQCRSRDRVPFDKNDDVAVSFITAVANLRAWCFHISRKSAFELRTIAGNIVPAIASTNAAIAAAAAHLGAQLASIDKKKQDDCRFVAMRPNPTQRKRKVNKTAAWEKLGIMSFPAAPPKANCIVCREASENILQVRFDASRQTLGDFARKFLISQMSLLAPCIYEESTGNAVYEHEEFETHAGDLMTRFCTVSNPRCKFEVSDFEQSIQWKVVAIHDENPSSASASAFATSASAASKAQEEEAVPSFVYTVISTAADATAEEREKQQRELVGLNPDASSSSSSSTSSTTTGARAVDDEEVFIYHPKQQMDERKKRRQRDQQQQQSQGTGGKMEKPQNDANVFVIED